MLLRMKSGWSASGRFGTLVCGAALLAGCATSPAFDTGTGLLGWNLPSAGEETKPKTLAELQRAHAEKPRDPDTTVAYSRALKSNGKPREALAVVEAAAQASPDNQKLVVEQGLLALELGQTAKAQHALMRASPDTKDWRILSGIGVAHAGLGQHADAQRYLEMALVLSPENPTVLNNLALSYILDKKVDKGRELLQRAAKAGGDKPQIAKNLEMAMALKGGTRPKPPASSLPDAAAAAAPSPVTAKPAAPPARPAKPEAPVETKPQPAEPAEPPATATAPEAAPEPKKTASVDNAVLDPIRPSLINPNMLNLGGPLAGR